MAPTYKITYFDSRGAAEPMRLLLAYKGLEFIDDRVTKESWPSVKPGKPWGTVPVLEEDGKQIGQSGSALRYLGKKYGLVGGNAWEEAKCDEYIEAKKDFLNVCIKAFHESDPIKKTELETKMKAETFPFYLTKFNELLEATGSGYLVGKSLSIADLQVASMLQTFSEVYPGILDPYPQLKKHQETVFSEKGIKEWVAKRPKTQF